MKMPARAQCCCSLTRSIPGARGLGATGCERARFQTPFVSAGRLPALQAPSHGVSLHPQGPESKPSIIYIHIHIHIHIHYKHMYYIHIYTCIYTYITFIIDKHI
jgi:hypothetical protein